MRKGPRKLHYVAEWIAFKRLSLRRLAQRLEFEPGEELLSASSLGRIARGEQALTPEILHALAHAFDCEPEDIIGVNPLLEPEVIDLLAVIRAIRMKHDRAKIVQATRVLEAIA